MKDPSGTNQELIKEISILKQRIQELEKSEADRKRAEDALQDIRWRLESIIEGTRVGTWEWNVQTGETVFNEMWAQTIGYTLDELAPIDIKTWETFAHPDDLKRSAELLSRHFAGELPYYEHECRMKHKDGHWVWVHNRGRVITRTGDGKPLMMFGTHTDITDRKRTEDESRRLASVVRHSRELVNLAKPDGTMVFLNDAGKKMLGISEEDVAQTNIMQVIPEHLQDKVRREVLPSIAEYGFWEGDLQYLNLKTGGLTDVHAVTYKIADPDTGALQFQANVSLDISERNRADKALRESEEKYRLIAENTADMISITDMNLHFTYVSPASMRLLGFTVEEAMARTLEQALAPASMQLGLTAFAKEMQLEASGTADPGRTRVLELEEYKKDGSIIWLEVSLSFLRDNDGKPVEILMVSRDITKRKQAEEALRESEEWFRTLSDKTPLGMSLIDIDGRYEYVNPAFVNIFGYDLSDIPTGKEWLRMAYPDPVYRREVMTAWKEDLSSYPELDIRPRVYEVRCKGGAVKTILFRPVSLLTGKQLVTYDDITERKGAEDALRESQQQLHSIVDGSPFPAFVIGKDHRVIHWNKALEKMSSIKSEEIVGSRGQWKAFYDAERPCLADLMVDEAVEFVPQWYSGKYIKSPLVEGAYEATDFFTSLGENGKWLRFTSAPIRDSKGVVVAAVETLEDITEKKKADMALADSEERYRKAFMTSPDAIIITRLSDGMIISVNKGFGAMSGYTEDDVIGKTSFGMDFWLNPEERRKFVEVLKAKGEVRDYEGRFRTKDGEIYGLVYASIVELVGVLHILTVTRDITARKRAEEESAKLVTQLHQAQKMEAIGTLAGGIAHDFNNILSAIMGYTDMALAHPKVDDRLRRYLNQVYKAGERATDLVKQILTFSRQSDQKPRPLRISPIIKEVLKLLRASLPTTITIRQDIQSEPDTILGDPIQIHQILMNLCTNAAHAMRGTKGELKVSLVPVEVEPHDPLISLYDLTPDRYLKLTVSDAGTGMAPEIMDRIFNPFFTTKQLGEGTGMGLAVVHGIIKSCNGAITVESEVGKGTKFHVYIPLLGETGEKGEVEAVADITGGKERILFVDDEDVLALLGKEMLAGLGYDVVERTSSLEALKLFQSGPDRFDLVITDMTMPNMTGIELAQEIMRIRPDMPVILCTGFSKAITPEVAKAIGLKDVIMKPIVKRQIAEAIRRELDKKE